MGKAALAAIAEYHNDVVASLGAYFTMDSPVLLVRFAGYTAEEVRAELTERRRETDLRSAFFVLAAVERAFRLDYEHRCQRRLKDDLSRVFRDIYKRQKKAVRLDDDIFEAWAQNETGSRRLVSELRGAFGLRHWLAHGRYGQPKPGRKYDFNFVYSLADDIFENLVLHDSG